MADRVPLARSGLLEAVAGFVAGATISSITASAAAAADGYKLGSSGPMPVVVSVFSLIGLWVGLLGAAVLFSRVKGTGSVARDLGLAITLPVDLLVGAVAGLVSQLAVIPLLYYPFEHADPTLKHRLDAPARADTGAAHGAWQVAVLLLFLTVGAPIVEELFFRGLILRGLTRWAGPAVGIVGSALAFGAAHFELLQLPGLVLFGLVLGVLAHRAGRLGPCIVAHAAFNAVPVLSLTLR